MRLNPVHSFIIIFILCGSIFSQEPERGRFYSQGDTKERIIAITFDDSPSNATNEILKLLQLKNVRATFFILGSNIGKKEQMIKDIYADTHQLANHTFSHINFHRYKIKDYKEKLKSEIIKTNNLILDQTGFYPNVFRMPHGYLKPWVREVAKELRMDIVHWSFGCDWKKMDKMEMFAGYIKAIKPGAVLLFHDNKQNLTERLAILSYIIDHARSEGYRFVTVNEMFGL